MSEFRLAFPACVIAGKHRLTAEDIVLLRKHTFPEGIRTSDHVVVMLALNSSCPEKCAEWNTFFIEQLAGFIVDYTYPQGSLDEINVAWIMRMFTTDGVVNSALELGEKGVQTMERIVRAQSRRFGDAKVNPLGRAQEGLSSRE